MSPETMYEEMKHRIPVLRYDVDEWTVKMMSWHFSEASGSPFWLKRKPELGFDPLKDVRGLADLSKFGLFDKETLRQASASDLVPQGFQNNRRRFFETGGTTGDPCRIVDVTTGAYNVTIYRTMLEARGLAGGNALAMTPSGPHAYGTFVARLLDEWCGNTFYIDFDPRWVKTLIRDRHSPEPYVAHLVEQTIRILETQHPIRFLFSTSKLLLALVPALPRSLAEYGVRAVCTGGTSCTLEERRYLQENYLAEITWIDTYGNTLMGHALQADELPHWPMRSYHLLPPQAFIYIVKSDDWQRQVAIGQRGRVMIVTLLEDLFIPNLLERDSAIRTPAHPWFPWEGVREVMPYQESHCEQATEGVY